MGGCGAPFTCTVACTRHSMAIGVQNSQKARAGATGGLEATTVSEVTELMRERTPAMSAAIKVSRKYEKPAPLVSAGLRRVLAWLLWSGTERDL